MQYTEANMGRIFILRLEDGDRIPDIIEKFAVDKNIKSATVLFLGSGDQNSKIVTGPVNDSRENIKVNIECLPGISEAVGIGTIFNNEQDNPVLHLHSAFGRKKNTMTGCTRKGIKIWKVGEVVIFELKNINVCRKIDKESGFELLNIQESDKIE